MSQAEIQRRSATGTNQDCFRVTGYGWGLPIVTGFVNQQIIAPQAGNGSMFVDGSGNPYVIVDGVPTGVLNMRAGTFFWDPTLVDDGGAVTFTTTLTILTATAYSDAGAGARCFLQGRVTVATRSAPGGGGLILSSSLGGLPFAPLPFNIIANYAAVGAVTISGAAADIKTQVVGVVDSSVDGIQLLHFENGSTYNDLAAYVDALDTITFSINYPIIWSP